MPELSDVSRDLSGFTTRLHRFCADAALLGIAVRVDIRYGDGADAPLVASYVSSPSPSAREDPPEAPADRGTESQ